MFNSKKIIIFCLSLALSSTVFAKKFTSQYCEFQLPNGWECALEGSEWVCQSLDKNRQKEAIIILAAKIRGKQDSLEQYLSYLKQKKPFRLPGGQQQVSEPKYAKKSTINDHLWIDALHLASEVPGFYTRYLATVKEDLGVAVTFSVAKDHYNSYQNIFDQVVKTLRVFRQKQSGGLAQYNLKKGDSNILAGGGDFIDDNANKHNIARAKKRGKGQFDEMMDYAIYGGIALVILLFALKKGKKKKVIKKKKKKKKKRS